MMAGRPRTMARGPRGAGAETMNSDEWDRWDG